MNINYISASSIPSKTANSIHVMKMANALAENGNKVTLFSRTTLGSKEQDDFDYYGVKEEFKLEKIKVPGKKFLNNIVYAIRINNIINKNKKNIETNVYNTTIYGRDLLAIVILSFFNKNIYYESHSAPEGILNKILLKVLFKSKNFKELVVISDALKKEYEKLNFKNVHINVLHDGADNNNIVIEKTLNEKIVVGYSGSVYKGRGIENIIEIARELKNIKFKIIGGTREQVANLFPEKVILPNNIEFLGYVEPKNIPKILKEITILLAPYQKKVGIGKANADTSKWMSPLKIFEYMAAEKAIISSDLPVLKEVLTNEYNCLLVDPENNKEWIHAIKSLINNKDLRESIAKQAKLDLENIYSWDIRAKSITNIIERKINEV